MLTISLTYTHAGGTFEMAQLWVNLPAEHKMSSPRYQPLLDKDVPRAELPGGKGVLKMYAGQYEGTKGETEESGYMMPVWTRL